MNTDQERSTCKPPMISSPNSARGRGRRFLKLRRPKPKSRLHKKYLGPYSNKTRNSYTPHPSQHQVFHDARPRVSPAKSLPCQASRQVNGPQPLNTSNITNQCLFPKNLPSYHKYPKSTPAPDAQLRLARWSPERQHLPPSKVRCCQLSLQ